MPKNLCEPRIKEIPFIRRNEKSTLLTDGHTRKYNLEDIAARIESSAILLEMLLALA